MGWQLNVLPGLLLTGFIVQSFVHEQCNISSRPFDHVMPSHTTVDINSHVNNQHNCHADYIHQVKSMNLSNEYTIIY